MPRSKISEFFGGLCSKVRVWHILKSVFRVWSFSLKVCIPNLTYEIGVLYAGHEVSGLLKGVGSKVWAWSISSPCQGCEVSEIFEGVCLKVWVWCTWGLSSESEVLNAWMTCVLWSESEVLGGSMFRMCGLWNLWVSVSWGLNIGDVGVCFRAWGLRTIRESLRRFELKIFVVRVQAVMSLNFSRFFVLRF